MTLWGDERAAAIQVGAAVLLGFVVIAISTYQVQVVPSQNAEVEFDHNQQVQEQFLRLHDDIVGITDGESGDSQAMRLGTTYPARTIFLNAAPPSGTIRTTTADTIRITNASATGSDGTAAYWNGTDWTTTTRSLVYEPRYHYYNNAPESVFEHGMFYNRPPNGQNITVADEILIEDNEITLLSLRGQYQAATQGTASVRTRALSRTVNTVNIGPSGGDVTITIPTESPTHWESSLADESAVSAITTGSDSVTVTLEDDQYELQMAQVGLGTANRADPDARAAYVTKVDDRAPVTVAEVRDKFNNPVRNAEVQYTINGRVTVTETTNDEGRLRVPGVSAGDTVRLWLDSGSFGSAADYQKLQTEVKSGGGGGSSAYGVSWQSPSGQSGTSSCSDSSCTLDAGTSPSIDLTVKTNPVADGAGVNYGLSDQTVASLDKRSGTTDVNGEDTRELRAVSNGTVNVYASSGSDGDIIELTVEGVGTSVSTTTINGKQVVIKNDSYGTWLLVLNYEHLGGNNPATEVDRESTFPRLPNGLTEASDVSGIGNRELSHVDNIEQWGPWNVTGVQLFADTSNHDRTIHYFTEDQTVIDSIVTDDTKAGADDLDSEVTKYSDHTANLPDSGSQQTDSRTDRIFGYGFPMYNGGTHHWAIAGYNDRWEVDDYPDGEQHDTVHRVWVRLGIMGETVVVTDSASDKLRTVNGSTTVTLDQKAVVAGPLTDFDDGGMARIPFVGQGNNHVSTVRTNGNDKQKLTTTKAKASNTKLAAGIWDASQNHVYFVEQSSGTTILRVADDGTETTVHTDGAGIYGIAGIGNVTADAGDELVYVDQNGQLNYLDNMSDSSETAFGHVSTIGSDNGAIGLGAPADFDDNGLARVPMVDGNGNLLLIAADGTETTLASGVEKSQLASTDWDDDGDQEIVFVSAGNELKYVDDVAGSATIKTAADTANAGLDTGAS
jgi:hypothetical protein